MRRVRNPLVDKENLTSGTKGKHAASDTEALQRALKEARIQIIALQEQNVRLQQEVHLKVNLKRLRTLN